MSLSLNESIDTGPKVGVNTRSLCELHGHESVDDSRCQGRHSIVDGHVDGRLTCPPHAVVRGAADEEQGVASEQLNRSDNNTKASLKTAVVDGFAAMPCAEMTRACSHVRSRLDTVIKAD